MGFLERFFFGNKSDITSVHQWVAEIAIVKVDRAIDRWNPHSVPVVPNPGNHSLHNSPRMKHSGWKLVVCYFRIRKTENIRIANRFSSHSRSQRVANDSTNPGIRSAIRLQSRWMVMGLHLKCHVKVIVKRDDPGVVFKDTYTPIVLAQFFTNFHRGGKHRFLEHIFKMPFGLPVLIGNAAGEGFMTTMLAPGLCNRLQFDICWLSLQLLKPLLNRLHFNQSQVKLAFLTQDFQLVIREGPNFNSLQFEFIGIPQSQCVELQRAVNNLFDGIIGQYLFCQSVYTVLINTRHPVLAKCTNLIDCDTQIFNALLSTHGHRIHHAGFVDHIDQ